MTQERPNRVLPGTALGIGGQRSYFSPDDLKLDTWVSGAAGAPFSATLPTCQERQMPGLRMGQRCGLGLERVREEKV